MSRYVVPVFVAAAFVLATVVQSPALQEKKPAKHKQWKIKRVVGLISAGKWGECEKLAGEGWELVCADAHCSLQVPKL